MIDWQALLIATQILTGALLLVVVTRLSRQRDGRPCAMKGLTAVCRVEPPPRFEFDRAVIEGTLDDLFQNARHFRSSAQYQEFLDFMRRFRKYSLFNCAIAYTQMPGARLIATPKRWYEEYERVVKPGARPIAILRPGGPVMWVFDVSDTEGPELPAESPFGADGDGAKLLARCIQNARRDGVRVADRWHGAQLAGQIQALDEEIEDSDGWPVRYQLLLTAQHEHAQKYATLAHELGHLYCGHIGTPDERWWPDRRGVSRAVQEFEAESVGYLVCGRQGISTSSDRYLAGYVTDHGQLPEISIDAVMKAAMLIEKMSVESLPRRTAGSAGGAAQAAGGGTRWTD